MHVFGHSWDEKKKAATIISFKFLKQQYDLITLTGPPIKSTQEIESKTSQRPYCSIVRSFTLKLLQYQTQKNEPFFVTELDFFRVSTLSKKLPELSLIINQAAAASGAFGEFELQSHHFANLFAAPLHQ